MYGVRLIMDTKRAAFLLVSPKVGFSEARKTPMMWLLLWMLPMWRRSAPGCPQMT